MSSSDSEDNLVAYGTPLEPLEEDEIPNKKPRLLEDQVVKDKQGRRRFHGAFTGGFSAGFFNTVGSLEGWTPSSFKSSKSKKQGILQQKPEDFMDEEDLSEFGIAPIVLKAKQDFTIQNKKELPGFCNFPSLGNYVLHDLLKPVRETVGIKLLKKMGWKPGQGVGPRLKKKEKENMLKMRQKTYGCQLPPGPLEEKVEIDKHPDVDSYSDSEWDDVEFAPNDCEPVLSVARTDSCGLGYEGLDKRPILSGNFSKRGDESIEEKKKLRFSSQAFGVGAFEEEDEDIYAKDDMSRYDFVLGSDPSGEANKSTDKNSLRAEGVIEGFVLETKRRLKKHYPLPKLPKDYIPHHKIRRSRFDQVLQTEKIKKDSKVGFEDRRKLLKEQSEEVAEGRKRTTELISNVKLNENEFKPFSSNPEKQRRYENYLKLIKIGKKELLSHLQPLSMMDKDKEREAIEFEKAALLFKPLSGGMEDKFLTARQPDDLDDPLAVVEKYLDGSDDRKKAAKMNMFGPLTRSTDDWIPCSLLCKRFNIPEPNKSRIQSAEKKAGKCNFNLFDIVHNRNENLEKAEESENLENSPRKESNEVKSKTNELEDKKINETQDKDDLFKAIFLASDEDEDENEDKNSKAVIRPIEMSENQSSTEQNLQNDLLFEEKLINTKRNLSPPSGIFKNIDLEVLSGGKRKTEETQTAMEYIRPIETIETDSLSVNLVYGPKMPEKVEVKARFSSTESLQDDGVWVEKKPRGEKKHKKKNKKKAFHKSKHKHKKRSR